MKLTFSFLLMLFTLTGRAQVCIGCTEKEVYDWCAEKGFKCTEQTAIDNQRYVVVEEPIGVCSHFFDKGVCFFGIYMPIDDTAIKLTIDVFDDMFTKVSATEWRDMLGTEEVVVIMKTKDGQTYFEHSTLEYYNKTKSANK